MRKEQLDSSDGEDIGDDLVEDIGIGGGANKRGASMRFQRSDMAAKVSNYHHNHHHDHHHLYK